MPRLLLLVLALVSTTGCYNYTSIRPSELPRLNGAYTEQVGVRHTPQGRVGVYEASTRTVEAPDGTLHEVVGRFGARVQLRDGRELEFEHPVRSTIDMGTLSVVGSNRAATRLTLTAIERLDVVQRSGWKTTLLISAIIYGVTGLALGLTLPFLL